MTHARPRKSAFKLGLLALALTTALGGPLSLMPADALAKTTGGAEVDIP